MKNMTRLLASMALLLAGMSSAKAETRLTFVGFAPAGAGSEVIPNWWMDQIEERTNGEVEFRRFPNQQLCKTGEIVECVRDGRADVGSTPQAYTPAYFPISLLDSLPISSDQAAINRAFWQLYKDTPEFRAEHEQLGLHLQLYWAADPLLVGTTFEVDSPDDFTGKRIRGVGIGPGAFVEVLGAQPVALTSTEQYEALRSGVVDGVTSSFEGGIAMRLNEVADYWYDPGFGTYAGVGLWLSDAAWQRLTPEQQRIVSEVSGELANGKANELHFQTLAGFCDRFRSAGNVKIFDAWPKDQMDAVKAQASEKAYDQWASNVERAGIANPRAIYDHFVELVKGSENPTPVSRAHECMSYYR
ncbi:MAG: TRAP transporter substrate-binding protein DctP [Paracoccus sp. (in: a-proteobacteria)]